MTTPARGLRSARPPARAAGLGSMLGTSRGGLCAARLSRSVPGARWMAAAPLRTAAPGSAGRPDRRLDTGTDPELRSGSKGARRPGRTRQERALQVTRPGGSMLVRMEGSKVVRAGTAGSAERPAPVRSVGRDPQLGGVGQSLY
jgi:hypothetical protein